MQLRTTSRAHEWHRLWWRQVQRLVGPQAGWVFIIILMRQQSRPLNPAAVDVRRFCGVALALGLLPALAQYAGYRRHGVVFPDIRNTEEARARSQVLAAGGQSIGE